MKNNSNRVFDIQVIMNSQPHSWNWDNYFLGVIKNIHRMEDYAVIEYEDKEAGVNKFTGIFLSSEGWLETNVIEKTIEEAVVRAIATRYDGWNTQASTFFCRALGIGK